jgi:hypothetical protein
MRTTIILLALLLVSCNGRKQTPSTEPASPEFFTGSWALEIDYDNFRAGWLEIRQEEGYLDGDLLWRGGSVLPVDFVFVADGELYVTRHRELVRVRDDDGTPLRTHHAFSWLNIRKTGEDNISGMAFFPGDDGVAFSKASFTGTRLPVTGTPPDPGTISYGEPVSLIAENSLEGWRLLEPDAANGWSVTNGVLKNEPVQKDGAHIQYGNLRTEEEFEDFNLTLEVNIPEGGNSGVYLRGIYEIQVYDTYGKAPDSHNMGALYSRITPSEAAEKPAGEWQSLDITLYKRHLTVILNGTKIIDNQPVQGVTGGAITSDEFSPGPIYLQGDHGKVKYRDMVLRPVR